MNLKKIILGLSILCFVFSWFFTFKHFKKSTPFLLQNLKIISQTKDNTYNNLKFLLHNGSILDNEKLFVVSQLSSNFLPGYVNLLTKEFHIFNVKNKDNYKLSGMAKFNNNYLLLYNKINENFYSFLYLKDDTQIIELPQISQIKFQELTALSINNNKPEVLAITDDSQYNKKFRLFFWDFQKKSWDEKKIKADAFYLKNVIPATAFNHKGNWYLITMSKLIKSGDKYKKLSDDKTNLMFFCNDLLEPIDFQILKKDLFNTPKPLNILNSGILPYHQSLTYIFSSTDTSLIELSLDCDFSVNKFANLFEFKNKIIYPLCFFTEKTLSEVKNTFLQQNDTLIVELVKSPYYFQLNKINGIEKTKLFKTNKETQQFVILPYKDKKYILTDNKQIASVDKTFLAEKLHLREKVVQISHLILSRINENPKDITAYSLPVALFLYPALLILSFFISILSSVLRPRPSYVVRRKRREKTISNYFFVPSLFYLIFFLIFLIDFTTTVANL